MTHLPSHHRRFYPRNGSPAYASILLLLMAGLMIGGCAAAGPKYIDLAYEGSPDPAQIHTLGISRFIDKRKNRAKGELGYRILNDQSREIFLVQGMDVAGTLTDQAQAYLERRGIRVSPVPAFPGNVKDLPAFAGSNERILTAEIKAFDLSARKKGALTEMTLKIDITFFIGDPVAKRLTTVPAALTLERTDVNFTREKVAAFYNQSLTDLLEKALVL